MGLLKLGFFLQSLLRGWLRASAVRRNEWINANQSIALRIPWISKAVRTFYFLLGSASILRRSAGASRLGVFFTARLALFSSFLPSCLLIAKLFCVNLRLLQANVILAQSTKSVFGFWRKEFLASTEFIADLS